MRKDWLPSKKSLGAKERTTDQLFHINQRLQTGGRGCLACLIIWEETRRLTVCEWGCPDSPAQGRERTRPHRLPKDTLRRLFFPTLVKSGKYIRQASLHTPTYPLSLHTPHVSGKYFKKNSEQKFSQVHRCYFKSLVLTVAPFYSKTLSLTNTELNVKIPSQAFIDLP